MPLPVEQRHPDTLRGKVPREPENVTNHSALRGGGQVARIESDTERCHVSHVRPMSAGLATKFQESPDPTASKNDSPRERGGQPGSQSSNLQTTSWWRANSSNTCSVEVP